MATATFVEDSSRRGGPLTVSKSSTRIAKLRRGASSGGAAVAAAVGSGANQRPPPTVYKIEPEGFQSLVQELTGLNSSSLQQQQQRQESKIAGSAFNRLQSLAPPPIAAPFKPSSSSSFYTPISPKFDFLGSSPKFAFPPLTFSPLADLTPRDSVWASGLESPEIKSYSQLVAGDDSSSQKIDRAGSFTFLSSPGYNGGGFGFNNSEFNFASL